MPDAPTAPTTPARLSHDEIIRREKLLYDMTVALGGNPIDTLAEDRRYRWRQIVPSIVRNVALVEWEIRMAAAHGPLVAIHANIVDWITGLLICRYGEAEYHWPNEFSAGDVRRALQWERGERPEGCRHLC